MYNPLWRFLAIRKLFFRKNSYLRLSGWLESCRRGYPCDKSGAPRPWMNYAIVHFLEERLNKSHALFEYGSGFSTLFYADLVASVESVENSAYWYEQMNAQVPANANVTLVPADIDGDYCRSILNLSKTYDVVVIDGRDRANCLLQSLSKLSPKGVVILDDSSRERYKPLIATALEQGFRFLHFEGLKPTATGLHRSTLFYRSENCFNI